MSFLKEFWEFLKIKNRNDNKIIAETVFKEISKLETKNN